MVYSPNSLSSNNISLQKAPSLWKVIAKNVNTKEFQNPKAVKQPNKVVKETVMKKMLKDADEQWVDKAEIVQWLLDRGYDIENPKTFIQKVGQTTKNIAGGIAWWLPALWPNIAWGILKGIWSLWVAPWLDIQTPITQWMQDVGQELIDRWEQARNITERAVWADPTATSTQLARSVVPIASQIVASWPLWLSSAWAWAFTTAKAWIAARSLPTVAKGVAQWALVWWAEQAMFDVAQTGKTTPQNVALWATIGGALPVVAPLLQKWASIVWEKLSKLPNVWKWVKQTVTRDFPIGRIEKDLNLTPTERAMVENTWETAWEFMLKKNIASLAKEAQINKLQTLADDSYNWITNLWKNITERNQSAEAKKMLETMMDEMNKSDIVKREMPEYIQKLWELAKQDDYWFNELLAIRRDFDRIVWNDIFNKMWRVSWQEDKILAGWRAKLADQLDEMGNKAGVDIKEMNNDIRKSIVIRDWLLKRLSQENKNNTFWLQDIWIWAILWQWDPITSTAIVIGKKALEKATPWISQRLYNLSNIKNVPTNLKRGVAISTRDTTNGLSIAPTIDSSLTTAWVKALPAPKATVIPWEWLPIVSQPVAPVPRTKQVLETWMDNVKQTVNKIPLVQSTKETPKLPVAKKTPLKQATDTPTISPKAKKPLIKATPLSKVDDALLVWEKMEDLKDIAKSFKSWEEFYQRADKATRARLSKEGIRYKSGYEKFFKDNVVKWEEILTNLNPTWWLYVDYKPQSRATMKLWDNITTLDKTLGKSPDEMITIYRWAPKSQKSIVPWDFISTDYEVAKSYAWAWHILSKKVKLKDVLDDLDEPDFWQESIYRP